LVLVVDDEPMIRSLVRATLRAEYRVLEARDGAEALAVVERADHQLSAIVTDVVMPGMGGVALAEAVGRRRAPPPILFISGYSAEQELPGPFLAKPFRPDALLRALAGLLTVAR
jgi:CheY-like chemotaxis protein